MVKNREFIPAVAVNVSDRACGATDPREVTRRGIEIGERAGLPLLFGMRRPEDWPLREQLELLRPGDIVTYCFRSQPHCIVEKGKVLACVREARERGILFDVGHGTRAYCADVARAAIDDGFLPDTISTDLQRAHLERGVRHDLPLVMSELRAAGMPEHQIFAAVTARPASVLGLGESGMLRPNTVADLTILQQSGLSSNSESPSVHNPCWTAALVVRQGQVITV